MENWNRRNLMGLIVAFSLSWLAWDSMFLYPVRLFATFCHEAGHAIAALITGGAVGFIRIAPNTAGVTMTHGGWPVIITSGGYVGSVFFGCAILLISAERRTARYVLEVLAVAMLGLTLFYARDVFTFGYGLATGIALWVVGTRATAAVEFYTAQTLGVLTASMALMDIRTLILPSGILVGADGAPAATDAQALARMTGLPSLVWASLWALISVAAVAWVLRHNLRKSRP